MKYEYFTKETYFNINFDSVEMLVDADPFTKLWLKTRRFLNSWDVNLSDDTNLIEAF